LEWESTPWRLQDESKHAGIEGKQAARQRLQGGLIRSQTVAGSGDEGGPEAALATQGELGNVHAWKADRFQQLTRRFTSWLAALEEARDDEARAAGVEGADLAAALIGSLRFNSAKCCTGGVGLIGQPEVVQARIARLLRPLPDAVLPRDSSRIVIAALLVLTLALAMVWGLFAANL